VMLAVAPRRAEAMNVPGSRRGSVPKLASCTTKRPGAMRSRCRWAEEYYAALDTEALDDLITLDCAGMRDGSGHFIFDPDSSACVEFSASERAMTLVAG